MDASIFNKPPFLTLPINQGDLFDLTAELLRIKLIKAAEAYRRIIELASAITADTIGFHQDEILFNETDDFITNYYQIVRCIDLSLGNKTKNVKNPQIILQPFGYKNNNPLHLELRGIRKTTEHFEERLQIYDQQMEPFLQINYYGANYQWSCRFGSGGFQKSASGSAVKEIFEENKISFQSYKLDGKLIPVNVSLADIANDIDLIAELLKQNLDTAILAKGKWCAPPRDVSVIMTQDDN